LPDGRHCVQFSAALPLTLFCYDFPVGYRLTPSYHDYFELSYIFKGKGIFHIEDQSRHVTERDVLLVGNAVMHRLEAVPGGSLKVICIYFMPALVCPKVSFGWESKYRSLFAQPLSGRNGSSGVYVDTDRRILKTIQAIDNEIASKGDYYEQAVQVHLLRALLLILRSFGNQVAPLKQSRGEEQDRARRLEPAFSYVQSHYRERIFSTQLARAAYMSPSYFCRFFKKTTGMTPTDYIHRIRVDRAKTLLLQTDMPVTQVAYEVGFASHSYFDSIFRRLTGFTPGDLQRALRGDEHYP